MDKLTGRWCIRQATWHSLFNVYVEVEDTTGVVPKYWRKASKDEIIQLNILAIQDT